jgi:osmotically-inducible protein OsmY
MIKSKLLLLALPLALSMGCRSHMTGVAVGVPDHEAGYARTSSREAVRVYPEPSSSNLGNTGAPMDDMDVAVRIRNEIQKDPALRKAARNVDIEVTGGRMILRGTVAHEHDRALIREHFDRYPGIMSTEDRLSVGNP